MRKTVFSIVAASVILTGLALAGDHKCTMTTQECLNAMAAKLKSSGWIGVMLDRDDDGLWEVKEVVEGSPAERAGILPGDVLYAMNGIPMLPKNEEQLMKARKGLKAGSSVTYTVRRDGGSRDLTMTMAPMPANVMAKYIGEHMLEHAAQDAASKDPSKPLVKDPSKPSKKN